MLEREINRSEAQSTGSGLEGIDNGAKATRERDQAELNAAIDLLTGTYNNLESAHNKRIILFAGPSGAGKSTTINLLLGNKLLEKSIHQTVDSSTTEEIPSEEVVDVSDEEIATIAEGVSELKVIDVANSGEKSGPKIGHYGSETVFPSVYDASKSDFAYCDTAGLLDSRNEAYRLNCRFGIGLSVRVAEAFKGMAIVLSYEDLIAARGSIFNEIAKFLLETFQSPDWYASNFLFIITKFPENIADYYKKGVNVYDNKVPEVVKVLERIKLSQNNTAEGYQIQGVINIILNNRQNIIPLKKTDLLEEKKSKKYIEKINSFFAQTVQPIPKKEVSLGRGEVLSETYLQMFTRIRELGQDNIRTITENKDRILRSQDIVAGLWKQFEEAEICYKKDSKEIVTLEENIKKIKETSQIEINKLKAEKEHLPERLAKEKQEKLARTEQEIIRKFDRRSREKEQDNQKLFETTSQGAEEFKKKIEEKIKFQQKEITANLQKIEEIKLAIQKCIEEINDDHQKLDKQIANNTQQCDEIIKNKQNERQDWRNNNKKEWHTLNGELEEIDKKIKQLEQNIANNNKAIALKKEEIDSLAKDETTQPVGDPICYNENSVYGTVNKGTVKEFTLSTNSSDAPLIDISYSGDTSYKAEGQPGRFSSKEVSERTGKVTYHGPSHSYGNASLTAYIKRKDSKATKSAIQTKQKETDVLNENNKDLNNQIANLKRDKEAKKSSYETNKRFEIERLNQEIKRLESERDKENATLHTKGEITKKNKLADLARFKHDIESCQVRNDMLESYNKEDTQGNNQSLGKFKESLEKIKVELVEFKSNLEQEKNNEIQKNREIIEIDYKKSEEDETKTLDKAILVKEENAHSDIDGYKKQISLKQEATQLAKTNIEDKLARISIEISKISECAKLIEEALKIYNHNKDNFEKIIKLVQLLEGYQFDGFPEFIKTFKEFNKEYLPDVWEQLLAILKAFIEENQIKLAGKANSIEQKLASPDTLSVPNISKNTYTFFHQDKTKTSEKEVKEDANKEASEQRAEILFS